jgi:2-C-methyl-D-erythritol 2,4-cyclodiphosphate synthase
MNPLMRIPVCGIGYDIHTFADDRPLFLGGVQIPSSRGLLGHSDADVLCHAIADAILGSLGERDIGHHFPNTDPSFRGISSLELLRRVMEIVHRRGARLLNIDSCVIAEFPKIGPHLSSMREALGCVLGIPEKRIGIKATTNEGMGSIGRGEGIAAFATACLLVPEETGDECSSGSASRE